MVPHLCLSDYRSATSLQHNARTNSSLRVPAVSRSRIIAGQRIQNVMFRPSRPLCRQALRNNTQKKPPPKKNPFTCFAHVLAELSITGLTPGAASFWAGRCLGCDHAGGKPWMRTPGRGFKSGSRVIIVPLLPASYLCLSPYPCASSPRALLIRLNLLKVSGIGDSNVLPKLCH